MRWLLYILGAGLAVLLLTETMTADTEYSSGDVAAGSPPVSDDEQGSGGSAGSLSDGLDNFLQGIFDHEGAGKRDANNNPGNLTAPSDDYWQGQQGRDGRFAKFGDMGDGWRALNVDVHTVVKNHPDWNFFDFFKHYLSKDANSADPNNSPEVYANAVADYMGVDPNTPVSEAIS
jgi:hypothetical protein